MNQLEQLNLICIPIKPINLICIFIRSNKYGWGFVWRHWSRDCDVTLGAEPANLHPLYSPVPLQLRLPQILHRIKRDRKRTQV